jgi:hypothetical protein
MKNQKSEKPKISEGIILALLSAGSYLFAFYYEKGYASVFNIPTSFISVNINSILVFGTILASILLIVLPFVNMFIFLTTGRVHPIIQRSLISVLFLGVVLLFQIYIYGLSNWRSWILILIFLVIFLFLDFVFPVLTQRGKTYVGKLESQEEFDQQFTSFFSLLRAKLGNTALMIVAVFLVGMYIASTAGTAEAIRQDSFLVTNTSPELVVLRIYGDNLICAPFDRASGEIEQSFSIIKSSGETGLVLKLENVGKLHVPTPTPSVIPTSTPLPTEAITPTISTP